jgi:hypothetical protein
MPDLFTITREDIPPDRDDAENDTAPSRCQFDGCMNEVVKPARGRSPKYCPEHRATQGTGKGTGPKTPSWPKAKLVHDALTRYIGLTGTGIMFLNVDDGKVIANGADEVATAIVNIGMVDKSWRKSLELLATPGKYGELTTVLLFTIAVPIMANHNLLPQFIIPVIHTMSTEGGIPNG